MVNFEVNPELEMIQVSCTDSAPPYHSFKQLIIHALIRQGFTLKNGTKLGKLRILSLNTKVKFAPIQFPQTLISQLADRYEVMRT